MLSLVLMVLTNFIFWPSRDKNQIRKKINAEKSTIASKPKSVETADSMTSNQIVAKLNSSIVKNNSSAVRGDNFTLKIYQNYSNKRCSFFMFSINNLFKLVADQNF
jgi:hypothetical protein